MNPRDFLKTSAVAGGSLVLANDLAPVAAAVAPNNPAPEAVMPSTRRRSPEANPLDPTSHCRSALERASATPLQLKRV
jgi:hypothetical protein